MIIKKKSILVIFLSCLVITAVLVITLIGFYIYLGWIEEKDENVYHTSLYELNAELFSKYIYMSTIVLKIGASGVFKNKPIIEGAITNKSNKKILSMKIKFAIMDKEKRVLYIETFYPIRSYVNIAGIEDETKNYLAPENSISFKHILRYCPKHILRALENRKQFAKGKAAEDLNLDVKIKEVIVE